MLFAFLTADVIFDFYYTEEQMSKVMNMTDGKRVLYAKGAPDMLLPLEEQPISRQWPLWA